MDELGIARIEVDALQRLRVYPVESDPDKFDFVYRAGMEISWDNDGYFFSPPPREWSYTRWLEHIVSAVRGELGLQLTMLPSTAFVSVPPSDIASMRALMTPTETDVQDRHDGSP